MLILVHGANNSGKSRYAESLIARLGQQRYYLATMRPVGEAGAQRIAKHRRQRAAANFITLELPTRLEAAVLPPQAVALLEDASNLLANAYFEQQASVETVLADILALAARIRHLVVVSISGLQAQDYDGETRNYVEMLHQLNQALAAQATLVFQLQHGQAQLRKGCWHEAFPLMDRHSHL